MKTEISKENQVLTVKPIGRIDSSNADEFGSKIMPELTGIQKIIFDFSQLDYISSAGLRVLLSVRKSVKEHDSMVIRNASEDIYEIFDITGFADILYFEK